MHRKKVKVCVLPIFILCFAGFGSTCTRDAVRKATDIAKDRGLDGAGEICSRNLAVNGECKEDLLECNVVDSTLFNYEKQCQIKSWLVGLLLTIIVLIPICIFGCCLFGCFKYHCFSRLIWWIEDRKPIPV